MIVLLIQAGYDFGTELLRFHESGRAHLVAQI